MERPLLHIKNLSKTYGRQVVLGDISCTVSEGQKIALIGRNGSGKSTLLKILCGDEEADGGDVAWLPWAKIGVVRQHEELPLALSVEDFFSQSCEKPLWEIQKTASRFGLHREHFAQKLGELSGGYHMRCKLVAMILQDPTIILLDEPVNYLDLPTLLLLEKFLQEFRGSFIVTAHDREFLQNTCTTTFALERGSCTEYRGTVDAYRAWKEDQEEFLRKNNKRLAKEIAHTQEFVDRFRFKASLASRAQNKIKHIARLRLQLQDERQDLARVRITIPAPHMTSGRAVRCEQIAGGYGDRILFSGVTGEIQRGDKVVIVGENGKGKTTLLHILAGKLAPKEGKVSWWHHAHIGFYHQKTETTLLPHETVLGYLTRQAPEHTSGERVLMMAGNFLFRQDDLEKPTSVLSGGERARLCLAGLLLREYNVLILDEPTNHLDAETAENLAAALAEYPGTVILVSHARTFVHAIATRTWEILDGSLKEFPGTYEEYVHHLAYRQAQEALEDEARVLGEKSGVTHVPFAQRKELMKEKRRLQERLFQEIERLEKEKSDILAYFFEYPTDYAPERAQRLSEIHEILPQKEVQWMELGEELRRLQQERV